MHRVLFLCSYNFMSRMAEEFAKVIGPSGLETLSAGMEAKDLHPAIAEVMSEVGINIPDNQVKSLADLDSHYFDIVITLCSSVRDICPVLPGNPVKVHWNFPEPLDIDGNEENTLLQFRKLRDEIRQRVENFFEYGYFNTLLTQKRNSELILDNAQHI